MNSFLFLGGDMRSIYAAELLNKEYDCFVYGFDEPQMNINVPLLREIRRCESVVLPLPASSDGENVRTPFFSGTIPLEEIVSAAERFGMVYSGGTNAQLKKICEDNNLQLVDYLAREEFAVMNAVPTAEGAIEIALRERSSTLSGSRVLITGYGRIAKVLVKLLLAFGAEVTVAARSCAALSWARVAGARTVKLSRMTETLRKTELIFNTVPTLLFRRSELAALPSGAMLIDLASVSCVDDCAFAESRGIRLISAQSLPGKCAPVTAGHIIASTILNLCAERGEENG